MGKKNHKQEGLHSFQKLHFSRFPLLGNQQLKAWNAADEYLLDAFYEYKPETSKVLILNDRFGFLGTCLVHEKPTLLIHLQSQQKALENNLKLNEITAASAICHPLDKLEVKKNIFLLKIPKSLDLYHFFIDFIYHNSDADGMIMAAFMTRHFSKQLLDIAAEYFDEIRQSKARKKSRIIYLSKPKKNIAASNLRHTIHYKNILYKQYYGVFSAKNIDYASQYLIEQMRIKPSATSVLDLASGNGVLAVEVRRQNKHCALHLMDDSYLAIASSKLNISTDKNCFFHFNSSLDIFEDASFDVVVSNPPFHFEHEIDINIPLKLFREVYRCLQPRGQFLLVFNKHLNYGQQLKKYFRKINLLATNNKFYVIECLK